MAKKKMIKSQTQTNWDNLMIELDYIHERLSLIETHIITLKTASNTINVTIGALLKLLIEKQVLTNDELDKMSVKMLRNLKRQAKKQSEKLKKVDKQTLYDALLKADFGGNA